MIHNLEGEKWLEFNAKLQQKKNTLRKKLKEKGVLQNGGKNDFDHYKYFSEAQYKELFTELFSECGLELKFNEIEYKTFEGTQKQSNGRMPKLEFLLYDIDTGFYETTTITGEAIDKGDKAGYKAYTGALKYYLANTFMVATGDDPDNESQSENTDDKDNATFESVVNGKKATPQQVKVLADTYTGDNLKKLLEMNNIDKLEDMSMAKASELIKKLKEAKNEKD